MKGELNKVAIKFDKAISKSKVFKNSKLCSKDFNNFTEDLIIYGPNGAGKTSTVNILKTIDGADIIDYEDKDKNFKYTKNELSISPDFTEYKEIENKLDECTKIIKPTNYFKKVGITRQEQSTKLFTSKHKKAHKLIPDFIDCFSDTAINKINEFLSNHEVDLRDIKFYIQHKDRIDDLILNDRDYSIMKNNFVKNCIATCQEVVEDDDQICPACGTVFNETIKNIFEERIAELDEQINKINTSNQQLIVDLNTYYEITNSTEVTNKTELLRLLSKLGPEEFIILISFKCSGLDNFDEFSKRITTNKRKYHKLTKRKDELEQMHIDFYNNLKTNIDILESSFKLNFEAEIALIDAKKTLKIKLPRKVETYSTGEKNLMYFDYMLCGHLSNDTSLLIVDDPLSSLDVANQYEMMFSLVYRAIHNKKIPVIVFTHSLKCINLAHYQMTKAFKYKLLNKCFTNDHEYQFYIYDLSLLTETIDNELILTSLFNSNRFYEALLYLLKHSSKKDDKHIIDDYMQKLNYIDAAINRFNKENDKNNNIHPIFHGRNFTKCEYTLSANERSVNLSNKSLFDHIEKIDEKYKYPVNEFPFIWIDLIYSSIAIRVWVEHKLFIKCNSEDAKILNEDKDYYKYYDFINYLLPINGKPKISLPATCNRKYMMSIKNLLNQIEHPDGQPIPFEYSISLTTADLINRISAIKTTLEG